MDIADAISSHEDWRDRLLSYAKGNMLYRVDPDVAAKDGDCALGQWLRGEGKAEYAGVPRFDELVIVHAAFHLEAAALVRMIAGGQAKQARTLIADLRSPFNQASSKVVNLLTALQDATN